MHLTSAIAAAVAAVLCNSILSYYVGGWAASVSSPPFEFGDIPSLVGKHVVVTGANSGIGYISARELARKGAHVFATCRDPLRGASALRNMKAESGDGFAGTVEFLELDLASMQSVRKFSLAIIARNVSVDILLLNAGVMFVPYMQTIDGYEWHFGVNYLSHFLLVKLLMQTLVEGSRVVHISSIGHYFSYIPGGIRFQQLDKEDGYNRVQAYGQSKLANILFSNSLARRLHGTGISSNAVHPGVVNTNLFRHVDPLSSTASSLVDSIKYFLYHYILLLMDADTGAKNQIFVAVAPELAGVSGHYFTPIGIDSAVSYYASDVDLQEKLWMESELIIRSFLNETTGV